ncbi:hypothetical protein ES708_10969 [subsurface metagenome]
MEIKNNHFRTKNKHTNREIIINLDAVEYFDFIWDAINPDNSYTQLWIGGGWTKIPFCYELLMKHFEFYGDEVRNNGESEG